MILRRTGIHAGVLAVLSATMLFSTDRLAAQASLIGLPEGEAIVATAQTYGTMYIATPHGLTVISQNPDGTRRASMIMDIPTKSFVDVTEKFATADSEAVLITYSDGSTEVVTSYFGAHGRSYSYRAYPPPTFVGSESARKAQGDAVYMLTSSHVYVSRDGLQSWQLDTTGLNGAHVSDVALDGAQNVYAAASTGLFWQYADSNDWQPLSTLPAVSYQSVHVTRQGVLFVDPPMQMSINGGSLWTLDTIGIGATSVTRISEDTSGDLYAIAGGSQLYRRPPGGGWTRIDPSLAAVAGPGAAITSVAGDSMLIAGTNVGVFASTDDGGSWIPMNDGIAAEQVYGLVHQPDGRLYVSTSLGVFTRGPADTSWSKIYPQAGFLGGPPIASDSIGVLYTFGTSGANRLPIVLTSINGGSTWSPDSNGASVVNTGIWLVDPDGTQHAATTQYGSSFHAFLYVKPRGGSWQYDTTGFASPNYSYTFSIANGGDGYLYVSGYYKNGSTFVNAKVMRRPIAGGAWAPDTNGFPATVNYLESISPDGFGGIVGTSGSTLVRRTNGVWTVITGPAPASGFVTSRKFSAQDDGTWVSSAYGDDASFKLRGLGVFVSTDTGATWNPVGLDSIYVRKLVSYGDSTYVLTDNGAYIVTKSSVVTSVPPTATVPSSFVLDQNYPNPFNPSTTIRFRLPVAAHVQLRVYDVLGRQVATLVDGVLSGGVHAIAWRPNVASGVYLCRLDAHALSNPSRTFSDVKKMLVMK